ncbi:MAG: DUF6527 family protein [Acidimicrobiia bacterium]
MTILSLEHAFVETIPDRLDAGVLYVSMEFRTTMHLCACGCGNPVVLPLRPAAWSLSYNGESISMCPSVGNWSFPCQAHYWIRDGNVVWARRWSAAQVEAGRQRTLEERGANQTDASVPSARGPWRRVLGAVGEALHLTRRSDARPE